MSNSWFYEKNLIYQYGMEKSFRFILVLKYRLLIIFTGSRGTLYIQSENPISHTYILIVSHTHSAMVKWWMVTLGPCKSTQSHYPPPPTHTQPQVLSHLHENTYKENKLTHTRPPSNQCVYSTTNRFWTIRPISNTLTIRCTTKHRTQMAFMMSSPTD